MVGAAHTRHLVPADTLHYLANRFLLTLLEAEQNDHAPFWRIHWSEVWEEWIGVCTKLEKAYWHYFDDCLTEEEKHGLGNSEDPEKNFPFANFCSQFFVLVPVLRPHLCSLEEILSMFKKWKGARPAYGVILLNPGLDKVLLVQEFGMKRRWGFPKGTLEAGESIEECAAREAFEEVGVDVAHMIDKEEWFERKIGSKVRTLFIIPNPVAPHGISEATVFETKTKGEIGDIKWFPLKKSFSGNEFFTVKPFIEDIRRWVRIFRQHQATHIKAWQRNKTAVVKWVEKAGQEARMVTKLQWKDSGVVLAEEEEDVGVVLAEEEDVGVVVAEEEVLGVVAAKEEADVGVLVAEDSGVLVAEEELKEELLPSEFLPKAWSSFHLDHQQLHKLATGKIELAMEEHRIVGSAPVLEKSKARLMLQG